MENKIARNRTSPADEDKFIRAYLQQNPSAKKIDDLDVAAVITKGGIKGHALMPEEFNRSRDRDYHRVIDFIPDTELKKWGR
jgi:hypothetical protein